MNYYLILLIVCLIIYCIINENSIIEGYDAKYNDQTFEKCAEFCKTTAGCQAFGYDKINKICYPSESAISGQPVNSIFGSEYNYNNATCNKPKAVMNAGKNIPFSDRRNNSLFVCTEDIDKFPQYYFHVKGQFKNIGEGKNIDDIFDVDDYEIKPYKWPKNKFNYDNVDLLIKERENQAFVSGNVTQLKRIIDYDPDAALKKTVLEEQKAQKQMKHEQLQIKKQTPSGPTLDFSLGNIGTNIKNNVDKVKSQIYIPQTALKPAENKPDNNKIVAKPKKEQYIVYKQYNDFNIGKYLKDYKCVKDIPYEECVKYCTNNDDCIGFEFNPKHNTDVNVCCPYATKSTLIGRSELQKNGKFYAKEITNKLSNVNAYIQV